MLTTKHCQPIGHNIKSPHEVYNIQENSDPCLRVI